MTTFSELLDTRLHLVELAIERDAQGGLACADFLEGEVRMLRRWTATQWRLLKHGAPASGADPQCLDYLVTVVVPIALDPLARPLLIAADEIAAALLRGWFFHATPNPN